MQPATCEVRGVNASLQAIWRSPNPCSDREPLAITLDLMGTELCVRIWSDLAPAVLWGRLIDAIGNWDAIDGSWQGLRIVDTHHKSRLELRDNLSADVVTGQVAQRVEPDESFRTGIAFQC